MIILPIKMEDYQLKEICSSTSQEINPNDAVNDESLIADINSSKQISKDESSEKADISSKNGVEYSVSGLSGIIIGIMVVSPTLLIPQHYIMDYPEFWYEFTVLSSFGWCGSFSAVIILNFSCWIDIKEVKSWRCFIILYSASAFTTMSLNLVIHTVWTVVLNFHPPMPYGGCSVRLITLHIMMAIIWYRLPKLHRQNENTRQMIKYFYWAEVIFLATFWVYLFLGKIFLSIPSKYQWILAIFVPFLREIISRGLTNMCCKTTNPEDNIPKIACLHAIGSRHAIFLSVAVSSILNDETCYVLLGMDFLINIFLCLKIIRDTRKKLVSPKRKLKYDDETLNELALNERIEFVVPLLYFISFFIAYYGPNAELIGSIKNTLWHFQIVADVKKAASNMAILFGIDICSAIVCSLLLWGCCGISLFRAYTNIQRNFWLIMAVQEAYLLVEVRILYQ